MRTKLMKRFVTVLTTVCMILGLMPAIPSLASTINYGTFWVTTENSSGCWCTEDGSQLYITDGGSYTVGTYGTISGTIIVTAQSSVTLTLSNVNITNTAASAIDLSEAGTCTITLADGTTNTLKSGDDRPGIYVPASNLVTFNGTGSLDVTGGNAWPAIGTQGNGNILIESGNITATGGDYGAGIGSSYGYAYGNIAITGGTVTAQGGSAGAGIGGGCMSQGGNITVSGGTVTSTGGESGAGLGSGWQGVSGTTDSITITGGTVTANGGKYAAALGTGSDSSSNLEVVISDGTIYATGGGAGASAIGNGHNTSACSASGNVSISGGYISASDTGTANIIGSGDNNTATDISITGGYFADSSATDTGVTVYDATLPSGYYTYTNTEDNADNYPYVVSRVHELKVTSATAMYSYANNVLTLCNDGEYTIAMADGITQSTYTRIAVTADGDDISYDENEEVTVTQASEEHYDVTVTLDGVNMAYTSAAPFEITGEYCSVKLILSGDNTLDASESTGYAGLRVSAEDNARLTITSVAGDGDISGALTAMGGIYGAGIGGNKYNSGIYINIKGGVVYAHGGMNAAGIGGGYDAGTGGKYITISGGYVWAYGGTGGAGIGGGIRVNNDGSNGDNITVSGGYVWAYGGSGGAGIGGGSGGIGDSIAITGGSVSAYGGDADSAGGAGIGGGTGGTGSNITISGGDVIASGYSNGAGIGGGYYAGGENIQISGGDIEAISTCNGAGIGGGYYGSYENIEISGGTIEARSSVQGAGIGGGYLGDVDSITISGGTITAESGVSSSASSSYGAGIGGGNNGTCSNIIINGGTIEATAKYGAGIGGGYNGSLSIIDITDGYISASSTNGTGIGAGSGGSTASSVFILGGYFNIGDTDAGTVCGAEVASGCAVIENTDTGTSDTYPYEVENNNAFIITGDIEGYTYTDNLLTISGSGEYTVSMNNAGNTTSDRIYITGSSTVTLNGVRISSGSSPIVIGSNDVTISLSGTNTLKSSGGAALSKDSSSNMLTITSAAGDGSTSGTLTATGAYNAAGIGSGASAATNNITINGGTITANGGYGAAGIGTGRGQGRYTQCSNIYINGGKVTAKGGEWGAGIGGGGLPDYNFWEYTGGSVDGVYITGGTVTATGGTYGAGIGGGGGSGSTLTAQQSFYGLGGSATNIKISGGTVTATGSTYAAGIGGGGATDSKNGQYHGVSGNATEIYISGGTVTATGGNKGAGIGGGRYTKTTSGIYISGGKVTATSGSQAAGIGGGYARTANDIIISGGTVTATSTSYGYGIGGGYNRSQAATGIQIYNASVKASSIDGTTTDADGNNVCLYTIPNTVEGETIYIDGEAYITSVTYHASDNSNQYLYLPTSTQYAYTDNAVYQLSNASVNNYNDIGFTVSAEAATFNEVPDGIEYVTTISDDGSETDEEAATSSIEDYVGLPILTTYLANIGGIGTITSYTVTLSGGNLTEDMTFTPSYANLFGSGDYFMAQVIGKGIEAGYTYTIAATITYKVDNKTTTYTYTSSSSSVDIPAAETEEDSGTIDAGKETEGAA